MVSTEINGKKDVSEGKDASERMFYACFHLTAADRTLVRTHIHIQGFQHPTLGDQFLI